MVETLTMYTEGPHGACEPCVGMSKGCGYRVIWYDMKITCFFVEEGTVLGKNPVPHMSS